MNRHIETDGRGLGGFTVITIEPLRPLAPMPPGTGLAGPASLGPLPAGACRVATNPAATAPAAERRGEGPGPN